MEIPDEIERMIDELLNPKLPWPVILNRFLDQRVREEYSWARRNRRYPSDTYMPSLHSYGLGHLTFAIDTSGSIEDEELQEMLSEIKGIQQVFNPERMTIIDCDSQIHHIHTIDQTTDIMSLEFNGGGGTRFQPVLDYVAEHPTQALIYFTDLYGESEIDSVDYPEYGHKVAISVANDESDLGIVVCGSGIGISIAANKVKNIRAALCTSVEHAKMSRMHNNANILALINLHFSFNYEFLG